MTSDVKDRLLVSIGLVKDLMSLTHIGVSGLDSCNADKVQEYASKSHPSGMTTAGAEVALGATGNSVNEKTGGVLLPVIPLLNIIGSLHRELTNVLVNILLLCINDWMNVLILINLQIRRI